MTSYTSVKKSLLEVFGIHLARQVLASAINYYARNPLKPEFQHVGMTLLRAIDRSYQWPS
jgi:hypothetical protein